MPTGKTLRSRIVGEGQEAPDQLLANPLNWRRHPEAQHKALEGMLREVGWVQRVIVNKTTGHVVDGHLRVELAMRRGEPSVPVIYVELTPEEEKIVLAAIDPIGGLAETDQGMLDTLLEDVTAEDDDLAEFLDSLRGAGVGEIGLPDLPSGDREPFQQMTFTVHDEQKEQIDRALAAAKEMGPFVDSLNENSNGNALARVCEIFLGEQRG